MEWPRSVRWSQIRSLRLTDGLKSLLTHRLLEDRQGHLWIGTLDDGLMVRQGDRFQYYTRADGLLGDSVRALAQDSQGGIWIAQEEGLVYWDGARFVNRSASNVLAKTTGCNSVFCGDGAVWAVFDDWWVQ